MDPRELAQLLQDLRGLDRARALAAEARLVALGEAAVGPVCELLQHPEEQVQGRAAQALGKLRSRAAVEPLSRALGARPPRPGDDLRGILSRALVDLLGPQDRALLPGLRGLARDPDLFVRAAALEGIGRLGDRSGRDALVAAQSDPESWVREAAVRAMAALDARAALELTAQIQGGHAPVEDAEAASQARIMASTQDSAARERALDALVGLGFRALPALLSLLGEPRKAARLAAYRGLGRMRDRRALPALVARVDDPSLDAEEKALAARALAAVLDGRDIDLVPSLLRLVRAEDRFLRAAAVAGLVRIGNLPAREAVMRAIDDPDSFVREGAARSLAARGDQTWGEAVPRLVRALRAEDDPALLSTLLRALTVVEPPPPLSTGQAWVISRELLSHAHPSVRAAALSVALDHAPTGAPELALALSRLLLDENRDLRIAALKALARRPSSNLPGAAQALRSFLGDPDREVVQDAVRLLGAIGDRTAAELLLSASRAPDPELSASARRALLTLDPKGPVRVRAEGDLITLESVLRCQRCSTEMRFTAEGGHDLLRCPSCQTEHALARGDRPVPVADAPFGVCSCPSCPRRALLIFHEEVLACPQSGESYIRPEGRPAVRVRELPFGACACCGRDAQPLARAEDGRVTCQRTGREHVLREGRYVLANAAIGDVDAINRALLAGTLSLTQSGLPTDGDDVL